MITLPIECIESCPLQKDGYCTKTDCKAENNAFSSYNLCPYATIGITEKAQKSFNVSKIPLTAISPSV